MMTQETQQNDFYTSQPPPLDTGLQTSRTKTEETGVTRNAPASETFFSSRTSERDQPAQDPSNMPFPTRGRAEERDFLRKVLKQGQKRSILDEPKINRNSTKTASSQSPFHQRYVDHAPVEVLKAFVEEFKRAPTLLRTLNNGRFLIHKLVLHRGDGTRAPGTSKMPSWVAFEMLDRRKIPYPRKLLFRAILANIQNLNTVLSTTQTSKSTQSQEDLVGKASSVRLADLVSNLALHWSRVAALATHESQTPQGPDTTSLASVRDYKQRSNVAWSELPRFARATEGQTRPSSQKQLRHLFSEIEADRRVFAALASYSLIKASLAQGLMRMNGEQHDPSPFLEFVEGLMQEVSVLHYLETNAQHKICSLPEDNARLLEIVRRHALKEELIPDVRPGARREEDLQTEESIMEDSITTNGSITTTKSIMTALEDQSAGADESALDRSTPAPRLQDQDPVINFRALRDRLSRWLPNFSIFQATDSLRQREKKLTTPGPSHMEAAEPMDGLFEPLNKAITSLPTDSNAADASLIMGQGSESSPQSTPSKHSTAHEHGTESSQNSMLVDGPASTHETNKPSELLQQVGRAHVSMVTPIPTRTREPNSAQHMGDTGIEQTGLTAPGIARPQQSLCIDQSQKQQALIREATRIRELQSRYRVMNKRVDKAARNSDANALESALHDAENWGLFDLQNLPGVTKIQPVPSMQPLDGQKLLHTIYEKFLHGFIRLRRPRRALSVWNLLQSRGLHSTPSMWLGMMHGFGQLRDLKAIEAFWGLLLKAKIVPDAKLWNARIVALVRTKTNMDAALLAWNEQLRGWAQAARDDLQKRSVNSATMADAAALGDLPGHPKPTMEAFNAVVSSLAHRHEAEELRSVISNAYTIGLNADVYTYNAQLKYALADSNDVAVRELLSEMRESNIRPDVATFTMLLESVFRGAGKDTTPEETTARTSSARDLLATSLEYGVQPNVQTYTTIIRGLLRDGSGSRGTMSSTPNTANVHAAYAVMRHMIATDVPPDAFVYTALITHHFAAGSKSDIAAVESLVTHAFAQAKGFTPDSPFFDRLIEGYARAGLPVLVRRTLALAGRHNGVTIGWVALRSAVLMLHAAGEAGAVEEVLEEVRREETSGRRERPRLGKRWFLETLEELGRYRVGVEEITAGRRAVEDGKEQEGMEVQGAEAQLGVEEGGGSVEEDEMEGTFAGGVVVEDEEVLQRQRQVASEEDEGNEADEDENWEADDIVTITDGETRVAKKSTKKPARTARAR